ncbi:DNA-3-methyladenine glycosylase 2 [Ktedonobacter robiniae]|uniref:DNA-3-methyladenine glycosylase II n=1 Tax=Ktedonobacter robiniae TaxID=2778365 RepID=A0ABQ3UX54_9CHLR|nr:DNA-3-methyladenine glycosylase 2 [Ktedonobacter robiniae]GHO56920.1 DNA-3-methyladenine glycosylase [Ktedonobacter robiniae]
MEASTSLHTDFDLCYRAVCSRDPRFDGRFYTAVTSTGIYCRPICPARTPQARNIRFFSSAAAAEAAGFRACRRCHPESSPGSSDWNVRADLVARALRLIAAGLVDSEGVSGLAQRLAVSERHIHRELTAEVGVGPLALARSRRAQVARLLIDQTDLPLTEIAFSSGFASIRQFNETMQQLFGCAPSEFRRRQISEGNGAGKLALRLQYRPPYAFGPLLTYLERRALPGVEEIVNGVYRRTIHLARSQGLLELEPQPAIHAVAVRLSLDNLNDVSTIVQRCRNLFDLDADPNAIMQMLEADPLLAPLVVALPGLRIPGAFDGFELAVRAILGQQVSVAGARTLAARVARATGEPLAQPDGTLTHYFPTPAQLIEGSLDGLGITTSRIKAIKELARSVDAGEIVLDRGADRAETVARLQGLPGVGPWTASYIAMRALGDPDAFPVTDLGLRRAFEQHNLPASPKHIAAHAEAWRPWRAYATHYLWHNLASSNKSKIGEVFPDVSE